MEYFCYFDVIGNKIFALTYNDNRSSLAITEYDENGSMIKSFEKKGAKKILEITLDEIHNTATFIGENGKQIIVNGSEFQGTVLDLPQIAPPNPKGTYLF